MRGSPRFPHPPDGRSGRAHTGRPLGWAGEGTRAGDGHPAGTAGNRAAKPSPALRPVQRNSPAAGIEGGQGRKTSAQPEWPLPFQPSPGAAGAKINTVSGSTAAAQLRSCAQRRKAFS